MRLREQGVATSLSGTQTAVPVLVVDDEPVVRQFLTRCLDKWGYPSAEAGTAAEALEMMVTRPASVVLCDIKMPGHDGLWLSARLRALWPQTAIIMVTAIDDLQSVRNSQECGAVDYITSRLRPSGSSRPFAAQPLRPPNSPTASRKKNLRRPVRLLQQITSGRAKSSTLSRRP